MSTRFKEHVTNAATLAAGTAATTAEKTIEITQKHGVPAAKRGFQWLISLPWKLILFNVLTMPLILIIYWMVNSHGLRAMPVLATRLYKLPIPYFSQLRNYEGLYSLDLANVLAVLLAFLVWHLWIDVVKFAFFGDQTSDEVNSGSYHAINLGLAGIVIVADAFVFYAGLAANPDSMWGDQSGLIPAVAAVLYIALLGAIASIHVRLNMAHEKHRSDYAR